MNKVSNKMFFFVIWKGMCQALGWFFGLFGYKRDGKFAKCVWGMFAVSSTIVMAFLAFVVIRASYNRLIRDYQYVKYLEECGGEYVSQTIGYIADSEGSDGYLFNKLTGTKVLKGIEWIALPQGNDTLACYSDGSKRGYFNKKNGEVVIKPRYDHAWVFSEGFAAVEENDTIRFIDANGHHVFDRTFAYAPEHEGYVFHGGYCVIDEDNDKKFGLMNTKGITVIPEEYDYIYPACDFKYWTMVKGHESCVVDKDLNIILPMMPCKIFVFEDEIDVTMTDNTMRKYDIQGNLIDDFYISDFEFLEYELEETYNPCQKKCDYFEDGCDSEHKKARARLGKYISGNNKEGLMTLDGHAVTLPKYEYIKAIGSDTYICTVSNGDKEIINGNGKKIK